MSDAPIDCLVIGGGPAGLTAAIYLARFHLSVIVADEGHSRAGYIPRTRNHAGYPDGISGPDLLDRMRRQAELYGVRIERTRVAGLERTDDMFRATGDMGGARAIAARTVLLATGVVNHRPAMPDALHDEALAAGLLRYCPICDGFEVTDRRVGVIGTGERGTKEALFLRGYTRDIVAIAPDGPHNLADGQRAALAEAGIVLADGPIAGFAIRDGRLQVDTAEGPLLLDSAYPAMGSRIRSELARAVGATVSDDDCLEVDAHQRTDVPGLYAAGDVVKGLDQISHAMGEGGVAATAIRNDLAERIKLYR